MTTNIISFTKPCHAAEDCLHLTCKHCMKPIRSNQDSSLEHPGTVQGVLIARECKTHLHARTPNHLTDTELEYMRVHHDHAYQYHKDRRARGIPPEGVRMRGDQ